jgi:uncharacterized protein (TIGR02444 family)
MAYAFGMSDMATALPANPFWDFSLSFYDRPGVAAACLDLQDRLGADVNLVLFALWAALEGPGRIALPQWRECMTRTGPWREQVIAPLRAARAAPPAAQSALPADLAQWYQSRRLAAELDAERVEQDLLYRWADSQPRLPPADVAAETARNLVACLAAGGIEPGNAAASLRILLQAAAGTTTAAG